MLGNGQQIGHYRISSAIGAGGMGEVFPAIDSRLNRQVALKVLPENIASNKDRLRRFEQKAMAVSIHKVFWFGTILSAMALPVCFFCRRTGMRKKIRE